MLDLIFGPTEREKQKAICDYMLQTGATIGALIEQLANKGIIDSEEFERAQARIFIALEQHAAAKRDEIEKEKLDEMRRRYPHAAKMFEAILRKDEP